MQVMIKLIKIIGLATCLSSLNSVLCKADDASKQSLESDESFDSETSGYSLTDKELLGKKLFFDARLSSPEGQSCASCHAFSVGTTGGELEVNLETVVYPGAVVSRFGNRKPPAVSYAFLSPAFHKNVDGNYEGGQFWDGRAATLVEQAKGPLLNPVEQNNPDKAAVVKKVATGAYAPLFQAVFGSDVLRQVELAYDKIAEAIAAYESSKEISPFSSKYDAYLAGRATLSASEKRGLELFNGKGQCNNCHPSSSKGGGLIPFTNYEYENLGMPKNPSNPFYFALAEFNPAGVQFIDMGLGGVLKDASQNGNFKVPTLRNVDKRPFKGFIKAYGHNGYFKSLKQTVHFYNTRDIPNLWPPAEYPATVNRKELGNLGLSGADEDALVAFMATLTDGYLPGEER